MKLKSKQTVTSVYLQLTKTEGFDAQGKRTVIYPIPFKASLRLGLLFADNYPRISLVHFVHVFDPKVKRYRFCLPLYCYLVHNFVPTITALSDNLLIVGRWESVSSIKN